MNATNKKQKDKNFCGVTPRPTNEKTTSCRRPQKKRSRKHKGWIRGFKTNGITYYYYCYTHRKTNGEYAEIKEYLGTAERIRKQCKQRHIEVENGSGK
ncbi:MAG: hypothetical protein WC373_11065 [Smithella sp.]|jgi:hypothetical protein